MPTELHTGNVWTAIRRAAGKRHKRAWVAVAYFGKGAAEKLDLKKGSHLVVDASLNAVKSGQTHPKDLKILLDKDVNVYSAPGLHAKIYVFGSIALVGSANASRNSERLAEAMVLTTDQRIVRRSIAFIRRIAKYPLGPEKLIELQKQYRPAKFPLDGSRQHRGKESDTALYVVQLEPKTFSEREEKERKAGSKIARRYRKHRAWTEYEFNWDRQKQFRKNDRVLMVTREHSGKLLLDPPADVLHVRSSKGKNYRAVWVYLELPTKRRRSLASVAKHLGPGFERRLRQDGKLGSAPSRKLEELWGL